MSKKEKHTYCQDLGYQLIAPWNVPVSINFEKSYRAKVTKHKNPRSKKATTIPKRLNIILDDSEGKMNLRKVTVDIFAS